MGSASAVEENGYPLGSDSSVSTLRGACARVDHCASCASLVCVRVRPHCRLAVAPHPSECHMYPWFSLAVARVCRNGFRASVWIIDAPPPLSVDVSRVDACFAIVRDAAVTVGGGVTKRQHRRQQAQQPQQRVPLRLRPEQAHRALRHAGEAVRGPRRGPGERTVPRDPRHVMHTTVLTRCPRNARRAIHGHRQTQPRTQHCISIQDRHCRKQQAQTNDIPI